MSTVSSLASNGLFDFYSEVGLNVYPDLSSKSFSTLFLVFFSRYSLQESQVVLNVPLDSRIHARIIGKGGMNLRKLMDTYKVDIRFPRREEPDMDQVTITGDEAKVYEAEAELKRLEDIYVRLGLD